MPEPSARRAALVALRAWQDYNDRADVIIGNILGEAKLQRADRAFALELFYGVLRNLTLVDFWIGCLRTEKVEPYLQDILRLGLYQLFFLGTPDHAAVNESVELALPKARGLINGVLRNAIRDRDELRSRARRQSLSVRSSHPGFLVDTLAAKFRVGSDRLLFVIGTINHRRSMRELIDLKSTANNSRNVIRKRSSR